ncbi:uncharacterized protein MYCFIDRAFT_82123 [Pseudocercospora fijiensis CIRAD86]|uniref:DUF7605 domain-containing protein n=1 Tax=Pseudocercospora fijiensis (strain CIRAD86) TaxID=383855 RepID=M2Z8T9_PSEFD|nr:uncharacterized protein MYCFIDRAFT_82123 [Pseudocercospora fijiensis CIRAD86]EME86195.1 hypothetical protein MYCFIDRAFT_82123 [Pseudocercospora fijiensis CIRAD86]
MVTSTRLQGGAGKRKHYFDDGDEDEDVKPVISLLDTTDDSNSDFDSDISDDIDNQSNITEEATAATAAFKDADPTQNCSLLFHQRRKTRLHCLATPALMAGGSSCTYVGSEYSSPFTGQTKPFAAKIEYFGIDAIEELLSRMLQDYNRWNFQEQPDWDEDEKQELKRLSTTAFTTFRSLFCDQEPFESPRAATDFLLSKFQDDGEALVTMVTWCKSLLEEKEADEDDHVEFIDAATQTEFLEQLEPLVSSNSRFERPALWPLVRKVRIGLEAPRILRYVTLVDLPGLDDVNKVRVNASLDIMRDCDALWIVTKIDRAITDSSVDSLLMRYGRSFKMAVVCTGIDDNLDPQLPAHLENEGQSVGEHHTLLQDERQLRSLTRHLPKKIETRNAKLQGRGKTKSKKQKLLTEKTKEKLQSEIREYEERLKAAEDELPKVALERFEILVDARNSNTIRRLKAEKNDHLPTGKSLEVFCVSNLHYAALKGARMVNGPRLDAKGTGIPAIRNCVYSSAAPAQLESLEDYFGHKFKVFVEGLAMWAKSYSIEGAEDLLASVKAPQDKVQDLTNAYVERLLDSNEELNVKPLAANQDDLVAAALAELDKKKKWHWGTTRAFLRRDGNHKTSVAPKQSWTEQFLSAASKMLNSSWSAFTAGQETLTSQLKAELLELLESVEKSITSHPASMILPMNRIKEMLKAHVEGIEHACRDFGEESAKELRNIQLDLNQDRHSGYFSQAMSEAYKQCKDDCGTGVKNRSFGTFETHLKLSEARSPFRVTTKKLKAAIQEDAKAKSKVLERKVHDILKDIYRQFEDMVDEKLDDHAEEELRREFRRFLETAEEKIEEVRADLARIKRRYD